MGTYLWMLFLALQPLPQANLPLFDAIATAFGRVPQEVWGFGCAFIGAVYYAYEDNGWSLKRKIWVVLSGLVFGFAAGYGVTKAFGLTYWSYLVYGLSGILGFNIAGGFRTLGIKFKKDPLKTANDLNDLRRNIQNITGNEKSDDSNDIQRDNGTDNTNVKP